MEIGPEEPAIEVEPVEDPFKEPAPVEEPTPVPSEEPLVPA